MNVQPIKERMCGVGAKYSIERFRVLRSVAFQCTHFQFSTNDDRSTNVQFTTAPPLA